MNKPKIAFNTANLVARVSGYRFELAKWGDQHRRTVEATDEAAWSAICEEIAAAGYKAIEIWQAHAAPETMTKQRAAAWRKILDRCKLEPIGYAGGLRRETTQICRWLGIPQINGGIGTLPLADATALCKEMRVRFNHENHPEKSPAEILSKVGGGNEWLGVCLDTGWLGTQGVSAPEAVRVCFPVLRHLHIKDVAAAGGHHTCLLGTGVVDLPGAMRELKRGGYDGWYAWEDEPEDRNPMLSAVENRVWIENQLAAR
jgi:sugar phosphate isomerase/epimerase